MSCADVFIAVQPWLPWLGLLVVMNAVELTMLFVVWIRLRHARDNVMDAIDARLLEIEKDGGATD